MSTTGRHREWVHPRVSYNTMNTVYHVRCFYVQHVLSFALNVMTVDIHWLELSSNERAWEREVQLEGLHTCGPGASLGQDKSRETERERMVGAKICCYHYKRKKAGSSCVACGSVFIVSVHKCIESVARSHGDCWDDTKSILIHVDEISFFPLWVLLFQWPGRPRLLLYSSLIPAIILLVGHRSIYHNEMFPRP